MDLLIALFIITSCDVEFVREALLLLVRYLKRARWIPVVLLTRCTHSLKCRSVTTGFICRESEQASIFLIKHPEPVEAVRLHSLYLHIKWNRAQKHPDS